MNQKDWFDRFSQQQLTKKPVPDFDGETYDPLQDHDRLASSLGRVWNLMRDGQWRTLSEISEEIGSSEAGISARLRDLRKAKFRAIFPTDEVESCRVGSLWQYRIVVPDRWRR